MSKPTLRHGGGYAPTAGSPEHPHLRFTDWYPYYIAVRVYLGKQLRKHDRDAELLRAETEQFFHSLYVRPQTIRNGTPQDRADAILANVHAQQKGRKYWPQASKRIPVSLNILCRAMAVDLCLRHSGLRPRGTENRPRYRWVQIARSIFRLLRADRKYFQHDDGHGHVRTKIHFYRYQLQSWNVCKRLSERLEHIFYWYVHDHGNSIASSVLTHPIP